MHTLTKRSMTDCSKLHCKSHETLACLFNSLDPLLPVSTEEFGHASSLSFLILGISVLVLFPTLLIIIFAACCTSVLHPMLLSSAPINVFAIVSSFESDLTSFLYHQECDTPFLPFPWLLDHCCLFSSEEMLLRFMISRIVVFCQYFFWRPPRRPGGARSALRV